MNSEREFGTLIADEFYREMEEKRMRVCGHWLFSDDSRAGFVVRLAELLGVKTDGMVDTPSVPQMDGRTGIVSVPENLPQRGAAEVGFSMRGHS
jgi:hypothetical protein